MKYVEPLAIAGHDSYSRTLSFLLLPSPLLLLLLLPVVVVVSVVQAELVVVANAAATSKRFFEIPLRSASKTLSTNI